MSQRFDGKRALVTGAGKGIGRQLVKALVELGAETVALSRTQADLDSLKAECPSIVTVRCDVEIADSIAEALKDCGPIDLLVNNAAIALCEPFFEFTASDFDKTFAVNVKAPLLISQIIAKGMIERKKGGSIVNVSSQGSIRGLKNHTIYCASKAAIDSITRTMSLELGGHNIRVNAVNPTVTKTAMAMVGWSDPARAERMISAIPLGRFAEVDEVVTVILFLLSDAASMVSGSCLPVDGGCTANLAT